MVAPHGRRKTTVACKKTKILLRTEGGPILNEDAGLTRLLWNWRAPGSAPDAGIVLLQFSAGCFNGITFLSLVNFGRTALRSRVSMHEYGQPRSRAAHLHPRATPTVYSCVIRELRRCSFVPAHVRQFVPWDCDTKYSYPYDNRDSLQAEVLSCGSRRVSRRARRL